ncbi:bifunctional folylpolyglutamate synthase/dihydrofolate synthase [Chitinophagaceae bacterium LWZ2-11]
MNYQETLDYLFHKLPMFTRIGAAAYKKDLTNTIRLCEALGNPQKKFKSIHIAGTNGKGSTAHMLSAILQTAGYKTGLHTSPHLHDFRERIKIDGKVCDENFVIDFTQRIQPLIDELEPSFFEITVAMAFEYFALQQVDIAVIEVGLGGRLDSTNVITPELSIITNIGRDHMNILGDTLEKIAFEKAGIIKSGVPVIVGEYLAETRPIFDKQAAAFNTPIVYASDKRYVTDFHTGNKQMDVTIADRNTDERATYTLDLPGLYQTKNILSVIEAAHQLHKQGWNTTPAIVQKALPHVKKLAGLHGRWEVIHEHPVLVLDVGHNEDGIKQIIQQLELSDYKHLHIVIGMVKDKEFDNVLKLLPDQASYYFTKAQIPRALDETILQETALQYNLVGNAYPTVTSALEAAVTKSQKQDMILVCGSVFIVAEVDLSKIKW